MRYQLRTKLRPDSQWVDSGHFRSRAEAEAEAEALGYDIYKVVNMS